MGVAPARVAPVFPVASVTAALAHYRKLGFEGRPYVETSPDGPIYGFLSWGAVEIHLALVRGLDPRTTTSACYLYVSDAKALHAAWRAAGVGGRLTDPEDTAYGLREFAHIDLDGNLVRVGSELARAARTL
jgi:hypothetical protein